MVEGQRGDGGNETDESLRETSQTNGVSKQMESAERRRVQGQSPCSLSHVKLEPNATMFAKCPYL